MNFSRVFTYARVAQGDAYRPLLGKRGRNYRRRRCFVSLLVQPCLHPPREKKVMNRFWKIINIFFFSNSCVWISREVPLFSFAARDRIYARHAIKRPEFLKIHYTQNWWIFDTWIFKNAASGHRSRKIYLQAVHVARRKIPVTHKEKNRPKTSDFKVRINHRCREKGNFASMLAAGEKEGSRRKVNKPPLFLIMSTVSCTYQSSGAFSLCFVFFTEKSTFSCFTGRPSFEKIFKFWSRHVECNIIYVTREKNRLFDLTSMHKFFKWTSSY